MNLKIKIWDPYVFRFMCYASCGYWCGVLAGWFHSLGYGGLISVVTFGVVLNPFIWFDFYSPREELES